MSQKVLKFAFVSLLSLLIGGCKDGSCNNDKDCKGARVCENGACVDATSPPPSPPVLLGNPPTATTEASHASPQPAPRSVECMACATQEDFDAVMKRGSRCCPVTACQADLECPEGRVCCRIPDGQLCADARRCTAINRVQTAAMHSTSFPCNGTRCAAGQRCCPGALQQCVSKNAGCGDESETTIGFECDSRTNEPCDADETCRLGKVGRSPLTMTSSCQKR